MKEEKQKLLNEFQRILERNWAFYSQRDLNEYEEAYLEEWCKKNFDKDFDDLDCAFQKLIDDYCKDNLVEAYLLGEIS